MRLGIEAEQLNEQNVLVTSWHHEALWRFQISSSLRNSVLIQQIDTHALALTHTAKASYDVLQQASEDSAEVRKLLKDFMDHEVSQEKKKMHTLEIENGVLKRLLADKCDLASQQEAEITSLKDTLSRKLLRSALENDALRADVIKLAERAKADLDTLVQALHEKIESAVLAFHKPVAFDTALKGLRDLASSANEKLKDQSSQLHDVISSIGHEYAFAIQQDSGKSIHSNYSNRVKKLLGELNKDQLLNVLDAVSFEVGVVEVVGRALFAQRQNVKHQPNVFV